MCVLLSLEIPLCVSEEEERIIVRASLGVQALDLSFSREGASLGGKKLRTFLFILVLCFMVQFLRVLSQDGDFLSKWSP